MKRNGFTLAELLVTLLIIGVVAVITAPALMNVMPDKNKVVVLKLHKAIAEINQDLLKNPSLYWPFDDDCEGLSCTDKPTIEPYNNAKYEGDTKYTYLLKSKLDMANSTENSDETFTTTDGNYWKISNVGTENSRLEKIVRAQIVIDINGPDGNNCSFKANCKKPDQFIFLVTDDGKVYGGDSLTQAYIDNKEKLNDKKTDYDNANRNYSKFASE